MQPQPKKLLDQVRDALRLKNYAYSTEQTYVDWIKRFIRFHNLRQPPARGRLRHKNGARTVGPQGCQHDDGLYARAQQGSIGRAQPARLAEGPLAELVEASGFLLLSSLQPYERTHHSMSAHPIPDLLSLWAKGELTADQAIGHILQNLLTLSQRLAALEKLNDQRPLRQRSHRPRRRRRNLRVFSGVLACRGWNA